MGLIGKYVDALDKAAEDEVLAANMHPGQYYTMLGSRCLVGTAMGCTGYDDDGNLIIQRPQFFCNMLPVPYRPYWPVENRYDDLCYRYMKTLGAITGIAHANDLIKSRILCNQLARSIAAKRVALRPEPAEATA